MDAEVPGISVPAAVIERVKNAADPREEAFELAVEQARHALAQPGVRGLHLISFRKDDAVGRLCERLGIPHNQGARREWTRFCSHGLGPSRSRSTSRSASSASGSTRPGARPSRRSCATATSISVHRGRGRADRHGRDMLDVNAGIPLVDEAELLAQDDPAAAGPHRHPALHRLLGDRGARGRPRRLRGQGPRQLRDRRGRAPRADPADRRQARRGRDRPHERRDGHPRDRREAPRDRAQDRVGRAATTAFRPRTSCSTRSR